MSDLNPFDTYDPTAGTGAVESGEWDQASMGLWTNSIDISHLGDQAWLDGNTTGALDLYQFAESLEDASSQAYQAAWDAYEGPMNSEGYSAHDAALGYSSTDTSFIEPASSAGSMSMISDYGVGDEL